MLLLLITLDLLIIFLLLLLLPDYVLDPSTEWADHMDTHWLPMDQVVLAIFPTLLLLLLLPVDQICAFCSLPYSAISYMETFSEDHKKIVARW